MFLHLSWKVRKQPKTKFYVKKKAPHFTLSTKKGCGQLQILTDFTQRQIHGLAKKLQYSFRKSFCSASCFVYLGVPEISFLSSSGNSKKSLSAKCSGCRTLHRVLSQKLHCHDQWDKSAFVTEIKRQFPSSLPAEWSQEFWTIPLA